jgi:hypothetical protein
MKKLAYLPQDGDTAVKSIGIDRTESHSVVQAFLEAQADRVLTDGRYRGDLDQSKAGGFHDSALHAEIYEGCIRVATSGSSGFNHGCGS